MRACSASTLVIWESTRCEASTTLWSLSSTWAKGGLCAESSANEYTCCNREGRDTTVNEPEEPTGNLHVGLVPDPTAQATAANSAHHRPTTMPMTKPTTTMMLSTIRTIDIGAASPAHE